MTSPCSEWPSLIRIQITNAGKGVEKRQPSYTVGGNVSWYSHYGEQFGGTLEIYTQNYHMTPQSQSWAYIWRKLSLKKTHTPASSLQTIHNSEDMETTQMAIDRRLDQEDVVYIHTMEYYSAIKKNKIMPFAATWMELETLILSELSQKEKDKYHMMSLISGI